jgi:UDP-3-O-[3-hydroxymyristoyl] glucosamine N-acyltransferase
MKKILYIFGCSGIGKSICDSIAKSKKYKYSNIIFLDKSKNLQGEMFYGKKVFSLKDLKKSQTLNQDVIFAFYKPYDIFSRTEFIVNTIKQYGFQLTTIIDDTSIISPSALVRDGCYIAPNVVLDADSHIGANSIILFQSVISREVFIGANVFVSAGCIFKGSVSICENNFISAKAVITKDINAHCFVNAGIVLNKVIDKSSIIGYQNNLISIKLPKDKTSAQKKLRFFHP